MIRHRMIRAREQAAVGFYELSCYRRAPMPIFTRLRLGPACLGFAGIFATACSPCSGDRTLTTASTATPKLANLSARTCGTPAPEACPPGRTGPGCALTCDPDHGGACSYTEVCDHDGHTVAVAGRRAWLLRNQTAAGAARGVATWAAQHPEVFGLRPGVRPQDLGLALFATGEHGKFSITTLEQTYRGVPVLGPEARVVVLGRGHDVIGLNGRIIDGAEAYAHFDEHCSAATATAALEHHAALQPGVTGPVHVQNLERMALAHAKHMVWAAEVRVGGHDLGMRRLWPRTRYRASSTTTPASPQGWTMKCR